MRKKQIKLAAKERAGLEKFCATGVRDVRLASRAKVILSLDTSGGRTPDRHEAIAERIGISRQAVNNIKKDYLAVKNAAMFLQRKKRETPPVPPKATGELEARITALACGEVPKGCARWTLRLLAEKCAGLRYSNTMSHMTVSRLLKKTSLSLT